MTATKTAGMTAINTRFARTGLLTDTSRSYGEGSPDQEESTRAGRGSDLALVRRCAERDPAALREIARRYQRPLSRFLHQILGSQEDAEEALQDVFLRVWQQAARFEGRASVPTWLYRIAAHAAQDGLRRRKAQRRTAPTTVEVAAVPDAQTLALQNLERQENARRLQEALQTLRPDDRLLVVLYYGEEMEYEEIGEVVRCPYPVLKMRLLRARRRLRAALASLADSDSLADEVVE